MNKILIVQICFLLLFSKIVYCQAPTVGLRFLDERVSEGYVLFTPESNNNVYLINNCGQQINKWEFEEKPGATCYLLENGNLLRAAKNSIEVRDWDNNIEWSFLMSSIGNQHHDIEPLPNGNILCVVSDLYSNSEIIDRGRNPLNLIPDTDFKLDKIIEIQPIGIDEANVVWEWKFIHHLIQDFDNTKLEYGVISNYPERIDINYFTEGLNISDFTHVNGIDYNAELDQIIISARSLNEILIIDHSTTTEEAKGSLGGNFNKGGDILWRWGNSKVYGVDTPQKLFLQHDVKWVQKDYLDEGKISVFNNGGDGSGSFSSIHLLNPKIENFEYQKENNTFLPLDYEWSWNGSVLNEIVVESIKSGTHVLPNGNFIFCETSKGQIVELNRNGEILWVYKNPLGKEIYNQYEVPVGNFMFRAEKYPIDFIGFSQVNFKTLGLIEDQNSLSQNCEVALSVESIKVNELRIINPIRNGILRFSREVKVDNLNVFNITGQRVYNSNSLKKSALELNLKPGLYFISFFIANKFYQQKIMVI